MEALGFDEAEYDVALGLHLDLSMCRTAALGHFRRIDAADWERCHDGDNSVFPHETTHVQYPMTSVLDRWTCSCMRDTAHGFWTLLHGLFRDICTNPHHWKD